MYVGVNIVYDLNKLTELEKEELLKDPESRKVPDKYKRAAKAVLRNRTKARVSFNSGGKLSKWAAGMRRNR